MKKLATTQSILPAEQSVHMPEGQQKILTISPHRKQKKTKKSLRFWLWSTLIYLFILIVVFLYIFPLLNLANVALKTIGEYYRDPIGIVQQITFVNFVNAWSNEPFVTYLFNTIEYTVASTAITVLFSLFIAFPLARNYIKGSRIWYTLFVVALFLPSALVAQFQLLLHLGLYNTQIGYILVASNLGFIPLLIVGYLRGIPRELDEAAVIDGCGYIRYVLTIIVPLSKPVLVTAVILHAISVWNDIIGPTIFFSDPSYYTISLGLFSYSGQYLSDWVGLAAATLTFAAPLIVVYLFLQRYFVAGALAGSLKS